MAIYGKYLISARFLNNKLLLFFNVSILYKQMTDLCPLQCVNLACKDPSFLEKHETFVLTLIGLCGSAFGVLFAYFLQSRCKKIKLCCGFMSCDRVPPPDSEIGTHQIVGGPPMQQSAAVTSFA